MEANHGAPSPFGWRWGGRAVMFPDDGHPDMAYLVHDLTGDSRDEIISVDRT
jgi:hypothetical protein